MSGPQLNRRTALKLGGAAALASTAGCLGILDNGDTEYSQYLATSDDEVFFVYADFEGLDELDDDEDEEDAEDDGEFDLDDPMLAPLSGMILLGFGSLRLGAAGIGALADEDDDDLDTEADELLLSNDAIVVTGDIDTEEVGDAILEEPEDEFFATAYEQADEDGDFTFYEATDDPDTIAVSDGEVIAAEERGQVEDVIAAIDGDGRAEDEFSEFEWLLDTAGDGLLAIGGYGPDGFDGFDDDDEGEDDELEEIGEDGGFVASMDFDDDEATASFAASVDELDDEQQDEIRTHLETAGTDVSIEFENGRVTAEATYSRDEIEEATEGGE